MTVATEMIGLPDVHQRPFERLAVTVGYPAADQNDLTLCRFRMTFDHAEIRVGIRLLLDGMERALHLFWRWCRGRTCRQRAR